MGGICSKRKIRNRASKYSPALQRADQAHLPTNKHGVTSGYSQIGVVEVASEDEVELEFYCPEEGRVESDTKRSSAEEYSMLSSPV